MEIINNIYKYLGCLSFFFCLIGNFLIIICINLLFGVFVKFVIVL